MIPCLPPFVLSWRKPTGCTPSFAFLCSMSAGRASEGAGCITWWGFSPARDLLHIGKSLGCTRILWVGPRTCVRADKGLYELLWCFSRVFIYYAALSAFKNRQPRFSFTHINTQYTCDISKLDTVSRVCFFFFLGFLNRKNNGVLINIDLLVCNSKFILNSNK